MPTITPALKILMLVQPTLILAVAVLIGVALAPRVGLSSPAAQALATGGDVFSSLKPQFLPGVVGGIVGGLCIILISLLSNPFLLPAIVDRVSRFTKLLPLPTRILYGGITEELLLRWGLMTLIVWVAWRVLSKGQNVPSRANYVVAILVSSLVFAVGHLPVAFMLFPDSIGLALVLFVIIANSSFGVVAGYLYWKKGLESAIIAHMFCHVVLALASAAGVYF